MAEKSWAERNGVTPGKLVLIGVLAITLVGVVVMQVNNHTASSSSSPSSSLRRPRARW